MQANILEKHVHRLRGPAVCVHRGRAVDPRQCSKSPFNKICGIIIPFPRKQTRTKSSRQKYPIQSHHQKYHGRRGQSFSQSSTLSPCSSSRPQHPPLPPPLSYDPLLAILARYSRLASGSSADWVACCYHSIGRNCPIRSRMSTGWVAFPA
jgi:hypothetical protein